MKTLGNCEKKKKKAKLARTVPFTGPLEHEIQQLNGLGNVVLEVFAGLFHRFTDIEECRKMCHSDDALKREKSISSVSRRGRVP